MAVARPAPDNIPRTGEGHDRTDLSPAGMDRLKDDLIRVISRHIEIDPNTVDIIVAMEGREQRLVADIPLRSGASRRAG